MAEVMPTPTGKTPQQDQIPGQTPIVLNGVIDLRKTHPNLWRSVMVFALVNLLLGLNFLLLSPTFLIYDMPNYLWGLIFLSLGFSKIVFLNVYRNLALVRLMMSVEIAFMCVIALGTTQPFIEGEGSLQLPIMYFALALLELPLALEPFINPWTAKRN